MTASPWALPAFAVGKRPYSWDDVAAFARRDGRWQQLVREVHEGLACRKAGHAAEPAAVKQAAVDFRYRRRLITGEETEAWLRVRHVEVGEWMDCMRRAVLRADHPGIGSTEAVAYDEVEPLLWATGRCRGLLDDFAVALAHRVAAHMRLTDSLPATDDDIDSALDRFRATVVTAATVREEVARRQLDWLAVAREEARFATDDAAREAVLSVRDDGLTLSEVCELAEVPLVRRTTLLEEVDEPLRPSVLGARPGELVGPLPVEGGFAVALVESKVVPSVDDPDIRRRAAEATVAAALRREVEARVQWHDGH
ncbi:MAG TPA: hypothetical protein VM938_04960 [Acidimicrobiales bacterium]|nr:hypothetical protein [Acidimicrobiales bacterium]